MKHRYAIIALASLMLLPMSLQAADAPAPAKAEDKPAADRARPDKPKSDKQAAASCESNSGSHIRKSKVECDKASQDPGKRVISADDLNSTGEMNTGDALRKLDPRVQ